MNPAINHPLCYIKEITEFNMKVVDYNRFFANALPEEVFKYLSKSNALPLSVNEIAVFICHGLNFEVYGHLP